MISTLNRSNHLFKRTFSGDIAGREKVVDDTVSGKDGGDVVLFIEL